jgi:hypothetical protein
MTNQDEYGDEEDWENAIEGEDDEIIREAIERNKEQQRLENFREDITIDFSPIEYDNNLIPQIAGDMTEWIPVNMHPKESDTGRPVFRF